MKKSLKAFLLRLGHVQAQVLLFLLFWLVLTPYALVLRLFGAAHLPDGRWRDAADSDQSLEHLRRLF